jgi:hypothetical protein
VKGFSRFCSAVFPVVAEVAGFALGGLPAVAAKPRIRIDFASLSGQCRKSKTGRRRGWIRTPSTARASIGGNSTRGWRTIQLVKSIRAGENLSVLINGRAVTVPVKTQGCHEPSWVPNQKIENLRVGLNAVPGLGLRPKWFHGWPLPTAPLVKRIK